MPSKSNCSKPRSNPWPMSAHIRDSYTKCTSQPNAEHSPHLKIDPSRMVIHLFQNTAHGQEDGLARLSAPPSLSLLQHIVMPPPCCAVIFRTVKGLNGEVWYYPDLPILSVSIHIFRQLSDSMSSNKSCPVPPELQKVHHCQMWVLMLSCAFLTVCPSARHTETFLPSLIPACLPRGA